VNRHPRLSGEGKYAKKERKGKKEERSGEEVEFTIKRLESF